MLHTRDLILNPKWTGFGDVSAQSAILYSFLCGFALPLTPSGRGCSPRSPAGAVRGRTARSRSRTSCNGAAGGGARSVPSSCRDGSGRSGSESCWAKNGYPGRRCARRCSRTRRSDGHCPPDIAYCPPIRFLSLLRVVRAHGYPHAHDAPH
jgi:hypothetical protein